MHRREEGGQFAQVVLEAFLEVCSHQALDLTGGAWIANFIHASPTGSFVLGRWAPADCCPGGQSVERSFVPGKTTFGNWTIQLCTRLRMHQPSRYVPCHTGQPGCLLIVTGLCNHRWLNSATCRREDLCGRLGRASQFHQNHGTECQGFLHLASAPPAAHHFRNTCRRGRRARFKFTFCKVRGSFLRHQ